MLKDKWWMGYTCGVTIIWITHSLINQEWIDLICTPIITGCALLGSYLGKSPRSGE